MSTRNRLVFVLALAVWGCSDDQLVTQTNEKTKRLSDMDDDGMFMSDDCMSGGEGCLIVPGPTECTYLEITTTTTVVIDSSGNIVREETTTCTRCLDADLNLISEVCSGVTDPPIICEAVAMAADAGGGEAPASDGSGGGGTMGGDCWWCHSEDGSISYYECVDPTLYCYSDAECPSGYHCEFYDYPPPCDPTMPCDEPAGSPRIAVAEGQCVPDAPPYCYADTDCPDGYYCAYYTDCSDPMYPCVYEGGGSMGSDDGSGSGSGSGGADALWAGGTCVPYEPPPPGCTVDADCGEGGVCVVYCDDYTGECKGYCEWYPPPDPCSRYYTEADCVSDATCGWFTYGGSDPGFADVPCSPDGGCGYCATVYVVDPAEPTPKAP